MKKIAVLTSGGDSPGMNACIRAVVRVGNAYGLDVFGICRGYQGLIDQDYLVMGPRAVSNIVQRGGTMLRSSRCGDFQTEAGRKIATDFLEKMGIEGLVVIGGDGSLRGAEALSKTWKGCIVGAPGTIDNDLYGSDYTIGCDTAVNTALEAIDKIRDTADSHERVFLVEIMGRHCGFNAVQVGIGGGAEEVLIPETISKLEDVAAYLHKSAAKGKKSSILIVAEGEEEGGAFEVGAKLKEMAGIESRAIVLGHVQRGGNPTAMDRVLATELGAYAVDCLIEGKSCVMVGKIGNKLTATPLSDVLTRKKELDSYQLKLLPLLAS